MIVTDLEHAEAQIAPGGLLSRALKFLRCKEIPALPDGKVQIDGEQLFAIVQRYETAAAAEPVFEYHRKYIDVQYIVSGSEVMGWAPAGRMAVTKRYNADKDACLGTVRAGEWTPVRLSAGQLAVFYPEDAHAPKLADGAPGPVMKIVIKAAAQPEKPPSGRRIF